MSDRDTNARAEHRAKGDPLFQVRTADIEPYTGLSYLSKLFRIIAVLLLLMLVAEVVTGIARQGTEAIPTLVAEVSRLIVLAGLLWGVGDLVLLLIDVGHDVRATRILMGRQVAHLPAHTNGNGNGAKAPAPAVVATPSAGV
ncbi:MAG: hypothetical protein JO180_02365 [Gemmatirosa sp.]|nr:hypothetical protein [Gemmatirosa sp.]